VAYAQELKRAALGPEAFVRIAQPVLDLGRKREGIGMPIQDMRCPRCGKPASEYDANKWQCLNCNTKFVYEPPPKEAPTKVDVTNTYQVDSISKENLIYKCGTCGMSRSSLNSPEQRCNKCGEIVCTECYTPNEKMCGPCYVENKRIRDKRERVRATISICILSLIVIILLYIFGVDVLL
jgi:DNA-directed RNA polymerase subunit RPC12/RpoP